MTVPSIHVRDANERMTQGVPMIDVREDDEWVQAHIPGAIHVPISRFMDHLSDIPKDREVLIHCAVGGRSAQAVGWLNQNGYQAINVAGGIMAWSAEGLPLEP